MRPTEALLAACVCGLMLSCGAPDTGQQEPPAIEAPPLENYSGIGGDFALVDQHGDSFSLTSLQGRPAVLFFGYTNCPDICPVTLSKMNQVHEILGTGAEDLATVFVTVDPERDTVDRLAEYLGYFGEGVIGLWGGKQDIDRVIGQYGGHYALHKESGRADYSVDHSTTTYLIDQQGKVRFLFSHSDGPELMAAVTRQLLSPQP